MRDSWRDDERPLEGELYIEGDGLPGVHNFGTMQVDGADDTTMDDVRRGLRYSGGPVEREAVQQPPDTSTIGSPYKDAKHASSYVGGMGGDFLPIIALVPVLPGVTRSEPRPYGRTHSRLVVSTYGRPIKRANSLHETVAAMRDAVVGKFAVKLRPSVF